MILPPTFQIGHRHKITNITVTLSLQVLIFLTFLWYLIDKTDEISLVFL